LDIHDDEIVREYLNADMLVFVSTYEGFGLPILEGQAAGRPVITSCLSPMKEVAGGGACLVDPYSIVDIREGVLRVIHDSQYRAMLIQAGFDNVRAYSPKNVARQYSSLYEALFSGAAPSHVQNQEHLLDKSAKTADRAPTLHVFGQHQPTLNNLSPQSSTPNYYSDVNRLARLWHLCDFGQRDLFKKAALYSEYLQGSQRGPAGAQEKN